MSSPVKHPVIQIIEKRKEQGSLPKHRSDDYKLGLVIEGGGMRGVVGAGMATALHYLGLVNVFDAVYGSSAGALAGSLFVTQTMPIGPTIYYDDLIRKGFIDLKNVFSSRNPIMNINYLMDTVLSQRKPLNWKGVIESDIRLNIIVSSIRERSSLCVDDYKTKEELFTLLKASATVPVVAGPPVKYKDDLLWDAALYEPIPYESALRKKRDEKACTHLLVLLTRPQGVTKTTPNLIDKYLIAPKMDKIKQGLGNDYLERNKKYNISLQYLYTQNNQLNESPSIYSICLPKGNSPIFGLVKDKNKLIEGAKSGMEAVMNVFLGDDFIRYQEVLIPFNKFNLIPTL
jgi:predicted patatin/cPLA2 family phospholipase